MPVISAGKACKVTQLQLRMRTGTVSQALIPPAVAQYSSVEEYIAAIQRVCRENNPSGLVQSLCKAVLTWCGATHRQIGQALTQALADMSAGQLNPLSIAVTDTDAEKMGKLQAFLYGLLLYMDTFTNSKKLLAALCEVGGIDYCQIVGADAHTLLCTYPIDSLSNRQCVQSLCATYARQVEAGFTFGIEADQGYSVTGNKVQARVAVASVAAPGPAVRAAAGIDFDHIVKPVPNVNGSVADQPVDFSEIYQAFVAGNGRMTAALKANALAYFQREVARRGQVGYPAELQAALNASANPAPGRELAPTGEAASLQLLPAVGSLVTGVTPRHVPGAPSQGPPKATAAKKN